MSPSRSELGMMIYYLPLLFVLSYALQPAEIPTDGEYTVADTDVIPNPSFDSGSYQFNKWSCPIPYALDGTLTIDTGVILSAMDYITSKTGWTFVARTVESDYLNFYDDDGGCRSFLGKIGGPQNIYIDDNCPMITVVHEIGHAIGIDHEQKRPDRDAYVDINEENIIASRLFNFDLSTTLNYGDYDYGSCMHYGRWAFANDTNIQTITAIGNTAGVCYIGQRGELTENDILQFNNLIDGAACNTPVTASCNTTNIRFCGVDSSAQYSSALFREFSIIGTHNGKNLYQSVTPIFTEYMIIYWHSFWNYWIITQDYQLDTGGGYGHNSDVDFLGSTNWTMWNGAWVTDPTISAAQVSCTKEPTTTPTPAPTTSPTVTPTKSPTFCLNAKYRGRMFWNDEERDALWSDEESDVLVSTNCDCKLELCGNGNLIVHEKVSQRGTQYTFILKWQTNTTLYNVSGVSAAKFELNPQGLLVINEYAFRNAQNIQSDQLWQNMDEAVTGQGMQMSNVSLILMNECCLELVTWSGASEYVIWTNCVFTSTEEAIITSVNHSMESSVVSEDGIITAGSVFNSDGFKRNLFWIWIAIFLLVFIAAFSYWFKKRTENQSWISSSDTTAAEMTKNDTQRRKDDEEHTTKQIEQWMTETDGTNQGEGTASKPHFKTEISVQYQ